MKRANLGVVTLSLLNVAAVLSIVNYPSQAEYGYASIFFIASGALCFFIPCALVSAEMASALPKDGGLYLWGKTAFNPAVGFVTVSLQWLNSLPWYGTVLTFIATTIAYMFHPELANNPIFVYSIILAVIWGCTIVTYRGIRLYANLSTIGVLLGTVLPTLLIISGAIWYLKTDHSPAIAFSARALLPSFQKLDDWMLLAGMMVSLAGIDMTALHITDVKRPRKNYPIAILISSIVIIAASSGGALTIALVVPPSELSMASGAAEAFDVMCQKLGMPHFIIPICLMLCLGAITTVFTWLPSPSRGLLKVADDKKLPAYLAEVNKYGMPKHILIIQASIISLLSLVVFFVQNISNAFWVFMAMSSQLYMMMYILMFTTAFTLRRRKPNLERPFKIPGGMIGMGIVCGLGILSALSAMLAGLIPPSDVRALGWVHIVTYSGLLLLGTILFISVPLLLLYHSRIRFRRPMMLTGTGILLPLLLTQMLTGCGERMPSQAAKKNAFSFPVQVIHPRLQKIRKSYEVIAMVKPEKSIRLIARVSGFLLKRNFQEGEFVKAGTVLYEIDPKPFHIEVAKTSANLAQAQADRENAKLEYLRASTLFKEKVASSKRYDNARAELDAAEAKTAAAEAALSQAKLQLSYTKITAPFDGWLGLNRVDEGNYIAAPSEPLAELSAIGKVRVEFHLSDQYLVGNLLTSLSSGHAPEWLVELLLPGEKKVYPEKGVIRYWNNRISTESATLAIQAEFANPRHRLIPGLYVNIRLTSPIESEVLLLDRSALRYEQNLPYVLTADSQNILHYRGLQLGEEIGNDVVILNGLRPEEKVTLAGNPLLRPGAKIQIRFSSSVQPTP